MMLADAINAIVYKAQPIQYVHDFIKSVMIARFVICIICSIKKANKA